ncbi:uncharacterized protein LOC122331544 [Puntigrus tetrazona]|uniref:uncharacterized protein LOC122331544 n=1 Tax=Puntigrus tetrazona TaxID=1606681 RepID=UPI001C894455|nr:uncharacterized protein LOC122331544 [Puntigrus tetrazona]XP_043084990.1 uncharacterized protein LOC122331544 [Puntigrus tetrazona]XP_043084991.1 uncharacterized protein LOC122331544 [Puntigrus tetrazona]XP_043084992.1 uncharacterized protein LOC122331544 [Puntigrus tetrazona]
MGLLMFAFVAVIPVLSEAFTLKGPSGPLVAPLGSSVVLPCYVDERLPMEGLKVVWRRTDSETLVNLYQDGESQAEKQQQGYHGRAHFFTDQINDGNFSLHLDNLRAGDEGRYTCTVHSRQESGETTVLIKDVERLLVTGQINLYPAYDREDVTLNCSVDSHIAPEHIEEVSWKKMDEGGDILVLLHLNNETLQGSSDEQYRDRVELFTAEIPKGNLSLRLKSVRPKDKGVYMCHVFAGELSASATAELERKGFSVLHIMVLIVCISASGSALLLCCLIYYTSQKTDPGASRHVKILGFLHAFIPNIMMFVAFVLWGLTEGFLYETVSCCAIYILRPLMLIYCAPFLEKMADVALVSEYVIFMIVYCSVIFSRAFEMSQIEPDGNHVYIRRFNFWAVFVFGFIIPFFVIYIVYILTKVKRNPCRRETCKCLWDKVADVAIFSYFVLPFLQFILTPFTLKLRRQFSVRIVPSFLFSVIFLSAWPKQTEKLFKFTR